MGKKTVTSEDLESASQLLGSAEQKIKQAKSNMPSAKDEVGSEDQCINDLIDARNQVCGALSDLGGRPCGGGRPC